jgi:hypothetical protein
MKRTLTLLVILSLSSLTSAKDAERLNQLIRESVNRNWSTHPDAFIRLCDDPKNREWCEGYFSASLISFKEQEIHFCYPTNEVGRYSFDGVWTVTKSWLYRQPKDVGLQFYTAVKSALTESKNCK